jgi:ankyrin repeat protein
MQIHRLAGIVLILGQLLLIPLGLAQSLSDLIKRGDKDLLIAVRNNYISEVKSLLESGVSANPQNNSICGANLCTLSPLPLAASLGEVEIVSLLLEHGALANEHRGMRSALIETVDYRLFSNEEKYEQTKLKILTLLLAHGTNIKTKDGSIALNLAASQGWKNIFSLLLDSGADIEYRNSYDNSTALIQAARNRSPLNEKAKQVIVYLLLTHGAEVNTQSSEGKTALMEASYETTMLLLDHGADLEIHDKGGASALTWAIFQKDAKKTALLLAKGAETNFII